MDIKLAKQYFAQQLIKQYREVAAVQAIFHCAGRKSHESKRQAPNDFDMIIVAKESGALPNPDPAVLKIPAIDSALKRIRINGPQDLAVRKIGLILRLPACQAAVGISIPFPISSLV